MEIKFELNTEDLSNFQFFDYKNNKNYIIGKYRTIFIIPFIFIVFLFLDYLKYEKIFYVKVFIYLIISILHFIFCYIYYDKYISKSLKKHYLKKIKKEGDNIDIFDIYEFNFKENYFNVKTPSSESKVIWSEIKYIKENNDYYFIYTTIFSAYIIPKNKLGEKKKEFEDYINEKKNEKIH